MSGIPRPQHVVTSNETQHFKVGEDIMTVQPLGAGCEVGRSAVVISFKGKTVMMDCGVHPAFSGMDSLPFFDFTDPAEIDLLLVTHFHLDHCGSVPYFMEHTDFNGRVFMTHPTKAIYNMILRDFVKVSNASVDEILFDEHDLQQSMEKIEAIDYHQELEHKGIKFWCYNAGHVLGAAMFMIEIAGVTVLYTGDFSCKPDRHLLGAEIPSVSPDVLIAEATYGIKVHESRIERENRFTSFVHQVVSRGGRCLIPVFALGRAQELLLILDEYWEKRPDLQSIPIYYASSLAKKCMTVFQAYINMMNEKIRKQFDVSNPFVFKHISNLRGMEDFHDSGPCVVMASPGMLQSGLSRELFELWCDHDKNGVIIPGYCVEGTLAKTIMSEPEEVMLMNGTMKPRRLSVRYVSFSAHSDYEQTSEFVELTRPKHITLVHGDQSNVHKLKQALEHRFDWVKVYTPRNTETQQIPFKTQKKAKVVGSIAAEEPVENGTINGLMVQRNFRSMIMAPNDLSNFTELTLAQIRQRIVAPVESTEHWHLFLRRIGAFFEKSDLSLNESAREQWKEARDEDFYETSSNTEQKEESNQNESIKTEEDVDMQDIQKTENSSDDDTKTENDLENRPIKQEKEEPQDMDVDIKIKQEKDENTQDDKDTNNLKENPKIDLVSGLIAIEYIKEHNELSISWLSTGSINMVANSLFNIFLSSNENWSTDLRKRTDMEILRLMNKMLSEQYGASVTLDVDKREFTVELDGETARIEFGGEVHCEDPFWAGRLKASVKRMHFALLPIAMCDCSECHANLIETKLT
eukprot:gb/GECH01004742.1/.p1 GENE.gb/GECH01004742.1/~~gb/GECH01004742.1/.p1  ORF type:complete len:803 (+),score=185.02 gb/GECH01004742.1/:1-2409(+)